jgi:N-acetylmuramoyl-L-alanine amidase
MRKINRIVIHCTATQQSAKVESILNYWKTQLGWKMPGYHFLISPDGEVHKLLPIDQVSNGAAGYNHDSIHISYIGGIDASGKPVDNRTDAQIKSMLALIATLKLNDFLSQLPVIGHRDLPGVTKACPSFDVKNWLNTIYK